MNHALPPSVVIHLAAALTALTLGPLALWARKGSRLHRAAGYAWVTAMMAAAISALFIRDYRMATIAGYTAIHLVVLLSFGSIGRAIWQVAHGNIRGHRYSMIGAYVGACLTAGVFALLPQRFLGQLVWHQWLGVV